VSSPAARLPAGQGRRRAGGPARDQPGPRFRSSAGLPI